MIRRIVGFHQDDRNDWVADLDCGHGQHVRHDPPWTVRLWATTADGRASRVGTELECVECDRQAGERSPGAQAPQGLPSGTATDRG
jgi:hypothetical protein